MESNDILHLRENAQSPGASVRCAARIRSLRTGIGIPSSMAQGIRRSYLRSIFPSAAAAHVISSS